MPTIRCQYKPNPVTALHWTPETDLYDDLFPMTNGYTLTIEGGTRRLTISSPSGKCEVESGHWIVFDARAPGFPFSTWSPDDFADYFKPTARIARNG